MINHHHIGECWRFLKRRIAVARHGFHEYPGDDRAICSAIIKDCYDQEKQYFKTSIGNFAEFWMRDFGLCAAALTSLGYHEEVHRTLQYALSCYSREGIITTQITPKGKPLDTFDRAVDSFPFLIRTLRISNARDLVEAYRPFLETYAPSYKDDVFDRKAGNVKSGYFSSIKDGFRRESSCYDNCCIAMLKDDLDHLGLKNPFLKDDIKGNIAKRFWKGDRTSGHFIDDLSGKEIISGDANTFPFFFNIITDKEKAAAAIAAIRKAGLDQPFPLKYTRIPARGELWTQRILSPGYEGKTVWLHLGLAYLDMVSRYAPDLLAGYLDEYKKVVLTYKTFPEVLTEDRKPYRSLLYICDEGMLWAANYLVLRHPHPRLRN